MLAEVNHPGAEDLDNLPLNVLAETPDEKLHENEQIHDSFIVVPLGEVVALTAAGTLRHDLRSICFRAHNDTGVTGKQHESAATQFYSRKGLPHCCSHLVGLLVHRSGSGAAPNLFAVQSFAVADRQIRERFGDLGAHKVTDLVVHSVTIHGASQPEVHRRVCVAHAVPHPRVEVGVGGNELEMGLAGWPVEVTVGADLTRLAHSARDVPAVFCLFFVVQWNECARERMTVSCMRMRDV